MLHVGKYFPPYSGGMENFLADILTGLHKQGVRVSAVVHDRELCLAGRASGWQFESENHSSSKSEGRTITVYRAPTLGRVLYAPLSPRFPSWLRLAVKAERPDVLHMHLPNTSAFWALAIPELRNIPWVIQWQSDVVSSDRDRRLKLAYPLYRPLERKVLNRASRVLVAAPPYLKSSVTLAPYRDKCEVISLGLDPSRIPHTSMKERRQAQARWGQSRFRILSVGRLTYYKGHEYLIKAVRDLPDARVLIVGEGERRRLLESLISDLNLDERTVLTGELPPDELHALMDTCDCLCLPSVERTEAFGLVLLEAMAHGKPVVACDIPGSGVSWVVENRKTGLIVPPADADALADAFRWFLDNRGELSRMGLEGWKKYQERFHIDRVVGETLRLYRRVA